MTVEDLRVFATVAAERSFSRAAKKLRRTQPAVAGDAAAQIEGACAGRLDRAPRLGNERLDDRGLERRRDIAQQFDMQSARRLSPFAHSYGSIEMMWKDGGVCGTMGNIGARTRRIDSSIARSATESTSKTGRDSPP